ncbi:MAG: ribonuclease III [Thermodesulfovibrio sp.]|nr:ribonuclease III [Thermodesulfovibrio sp.]
MHPLFSKNFQEVENTIGYRFTNPFLLFQALTHSSYANEKYLASNERLEFLGDIVLGFVISEYLYSLKPELNEAEMSKIRAYLISKKFLSLIGRKILIGRFLLLGKGERLSGGENKDSIIADAVEALIGAIYLDGGITPVKKFLLGIISEISASEPFLQLEEQDFLQNLQSRQSP